MSEPWRRRVGLVIGIDDYTNIKKLKNAGKDARAVQQMLLCEGGFVDEDLVCLVDPDRKTLNGAVKKFRSTIKKQPADQKCLALFYYAGHGVIDSKAQHYLLPRDWEPPEDDAPWALETDSYKLGWVLECFAQAYAGIVLIDACQEMQQLNISTRSGSEGSGILAPEIEATQRGWGGDAIGKEHHSQNLLVGHSCAPMRSAYDGGLGQGTYTKYLVQELCNPVHHHIVDALLDASVKVFEVTKTSKFQQQPRLDLSAKPGVFDSFRLERLSHKAAQLKPDQRCIRDLLQGLSDPCQHMNKRVELAASLLKELDSPPNETYLNLVADLDGVPLLLGVLKGLQTSEQLRLHTCDILGRLAASPPHLHLLAAKGAGPLLLTEFTHDPDIPSCRMHAAAWSVLESLLVSKRARLTMLHHGGVWQLINCIKACTCYEEAAMCTPVCIDYAHKALKLLASLLSDHCYVQKALRLAAETNVHDVLSAVARHKQKLQSCGQQAAELLALSETLCNILRCQQTSSNSTPVNGPSSSSSSYCIDTPARIIQGFPDAQT